MYGIEFFLSLRRSHRTSWCRSFLSNTILVLLVCPVFGLDTLSEDGRLDFRGVAVKYGYDCEEHEVTTKDGYILKMFRVPGDKSRPVLLVHGILDSSDSFITRGNNSMAATLSRQGYDVWAANLRGNRYSRRHVHLDPDKDKRYWDFSYHDSGSLDLPAIIDYILQNTDQAQLTCMGHSQGNTVFYVLGSMRPEYNDKVKLLVALSPISFLYHLKGPTKLATQLWPLLSNFFAAVGQEEMFGWESIETAVARCVCAHDLGYELCVKGAMMAFAGEDLDELEPGFLKIVAGHYFAGTSRKALTHLAQGGLKNKFAQMDYGEAMNVLMYNSRTPPDYDLGKVTMKVALVAGLNDGMCSLKDVRALRRRLSNVVDYKVLEHKKTNHIDFIWGKNMDKYLYPYILSLLKQHE